MNVSPDFKTSMAQFLSYYRKLPGEGDVNGVVAIDTQLLSDLVSVLGPVDVPGFGRFTADNDPRCNCPNIIYNLEDISTKPTPYFRSDRKAILGPMMATILQKAYSSDNKSWPVLFQTIWKNVSEKHVLFYFSDPATQKAPEGLQVAGQVNPPPPEADYFMVVDANLGGAKSNMFVSQSVDQDITVSGGKTMKKVTIIYKNPQPGSNCNLEAGKLCLNGRMPSWVRIYVPKGSTLVDAQGFDPGSQQTTEELGYTVFGGVYKIDPQSLAKIELTYTVPYSPQGKYSQVIQKQAGTKAPHYLVKVNGTPQEFDLIKDQTVTHTL